MSDDLTKPLGLKPAPTTGSRRTTFLSLAVGAAVLIAGATGSHFYFQRSQQTAEQVVAELDQEPLKSEESEDSTPDGKKIILQASPSDDDSPGSNASVLIEPEADGAIVEKIPVPQLRRQATALAHLPDPKLAENSEFGVLPKRSPDGLRPMDVYSRQPDTDGNFGVARVVLVVGGIGISQTGSQQAIRKLPAAVTLAFAPYGNSLTRWMQAARKAGHELLLQIPMQPFDYPANNPGKHTLVTGGDSDNLENLRWLLARITNYTGVTNFQGGKFVTDRAAMKPVFDEFARRGLLFLDDGSVRNSLTADAADAALLPYAKSSLQLDAVRNRKSIRNRLEELSAEAKRTGLAIGYANAFPESIDMISTFAREAGSNGIEITPISAIVKDPERGQE